MNKTNLQYVYDDCTYSPQGEVDFFNVENLKSESKCTAYLYGKSNAFTSEFARLEKDTSLDGMGGVYNSINLNTYHYGGNNPIKYVDPTGKWQVNIGLLGNAGAGAGGSAEIGISLAFSFEKGFTFGKYATESLGAEFGIVGFLGLNLSLNFASKSVESGTSKSVLVGGSCDKGLGVGGDIIFDLDTQSFDISLSKGLSIKFGLGDSATVGEGHILYCTTTIEKTTWQEFFYNDIAFDYQ